MVKPRTVDTFKSTHDTETIIATLRAELVEARSEAQTAEALREFIGSAKSAVTELQLPKWTHEQKKAGAPGIPTLMLSDLHWGERVHKEQVGGVNEFNLAIARRRLRQVMDTTITLSRILDPGMSYPGIVLPLGGDMISGNIHDELSASNELNTMPTLLDLYKNLVPLITLAADTYGNVFLPCVCGNHDRDTKKTWAKDRQHTSFGWLLYQFLAIAFAADKRITFYIPDNADAMYQVQGLRMLLTHGDQFKAGDSIIGPIGPITRGEQKKLSMYSTVGAEYDVMAFGHWHQRIISPRLRGNSSLKGYDEYAKFGNFKFEPPSQNFWMTHPDYGITFDAPVYCDVIKGRNRAKVEWAAIRRV